MSGSHRAHSARRATRNGSGRLVAVGGLAGVLATGALVAAIVVLRPGDGSSNEAGPAAVQSDLRAPRTGPQIKVTTPEGYAYTLAAVGRGTTERATSGATPGTDGARVAYADYVLTNAKQEPVLLDFPADLFIERSKIPDEGLRRCTPKPGDTSDMCTLPNQTRIIGYLNRSAPPTVQPGGDRYMPPGASYLVRLTTNLPVKADAGNDDLGLYVWNVRYSPERKAIEVVFP